MANIFICLLVAVVILQPDNGVIAQCDLFDLNQDTCSNPGNDITMDKLGQCGSYSSPFKMLKAPSFTANVPVDSMPYTFVMVDPDILTPEMPFLRYWIHWMVVDNTATALQQGQLDGETIFPYMAPTPFIGAHRYQFYVLLQIQSSIDRSSLPTSRIMFKLDKFQNTHISCGSARYEIVSSYIPPIRRIINRLT